MTPRAPRLPLLAALALAACQDSVATPFPPGLEPFADGDVPGGLPAPAGEALETSATNNGMIRAYGRAVLLAPPAAVWAAVKMPELMVARCRTTRHTITADNEPELELSFLVHYVVDDILTVEWDDQWRGGVVTGTSAAPELAMLRHQKVLGSDFIYLSEGTIQLRAASGGAATELWFVEHLDALSGSPGEVVAGMRDNFARLAAQLHGEPTPPCP